MDKIDSDDFNSFVNNIVKLVTDLDMPTWHSKRGIKGQQQHGNFILTTPIDFELAVIIKKIGEGKVKLIIAEIGGNY